MSKRDSQILRLFDKIPLVKEGKGDHEAVATFSRDMRMYSLFVQRAKQAETNQEYARFVKEFEGFILNRELECWCSHKQSKNDYTKLFSI